MSSPPLGLFAMHHLYPYSPSQSSVLGLQCAVQHSSGSGGRCSKRCVTVMATLWSLWRKRPRHRRQTSAVSRSTWLEPEGKTLATARIQRVHQGKRRRKETEAQAAGGGHPTGRSCGRGAFAEGWNRSNRSPHKPVIIWSCHEFMGTRCPWNAQR